MSSPFRPGLFDRLRTRGFRGRCERHTPSEVPATVDDPPDDQPDEMPAELPEPDKVESLGQKEPRGRVQELFTSFCYECIPQISDCWFLFLNYRVVHHHHHHRHQTWRQMLRWGMSIQTTTARLLDRCLICIVLITL